MSGLRRDLSTRQIRMIALGGTIGTGLFLGSSLAIAYAGPSVVLVFLVAAVAALAVAYAVAELAVAHPEPGGFGAVAHRYLGPLAGYVQRWSYWLTMVVVIGSEVVAGGLYVRYWWPQVPLWLPVVVFSVFIVVVNLTAVKFFGEFEYWFAMIKVVTIAVFIVVGGLYLIFGLPQGHAAGGTLAPNGMVGMLLALGVVTLSYGGVEAVAMTAAESRDPGRDVPRAARTLVLRLVLFYVLATAIVVIVVPWQELAAGGTIAQSPFVRIFGVVGLPAAAGIMNFVVLTAAISAANTSLYVATRMAYSLSTDGYAPALLRRVGRNGVPSTAVLASAAGLLIAAVVSVTSSDVAFPALLGIALFTGMLTWLIIFASHVAFRRRRGTDLPAVRLPGAPVTAVLGIVYVLVVLGTMAFVPPFTVAWTFGGPFVVLLAVSFFLVRRKRPVDV
ncbi:MAG TPA: amino acid permease [Actinophytocola sp.]|jgi:L-asparagine transporter-like permease|uniref:amino acid permease n=1 Tax=Actinophytocola sp. TaxID=1872138 RepID=UPI002E06F0B6|nr:amino acid permease [Actinophytocola sp.]